jgi:transposase
VARDAQLSFAIALSDEHWTLVADMFDPPPGRRGAPARIARRQMVDAMLFTGPDRLPVALLPERYGPSARCGSGRAAGAPMACGRG